MECRERHFMIAVDLSFTGKELRFEAVGKSPLKASSALEHFFKASFV